MVWKVRCPECRERGIYDVQRPEKNEKPQVHKFFLLMDTVCISGTVTEPSRFVRWLGFWLEDNMSTVTHFTHRLALASAAFASVKAISHHGKGLNPRACRHIAQAFICPVLLYGANLLAPTKGCLLKMGYLWNRVARWVTSGFYRTNSAALLAEAAMQPLAIMVRGL